MTVLLVSLLIVCMWIMLGWVGGYLFKLARDIEFLDFWLIAGLLGPLIIIAFFVGGKPYKEIQEHIKQLDIYLKSVQQKINTGPDEEKDRYLVYEIDEDSVLINYGWSTTDAWDDTDVTVLFEPNGIVDIVESQERFKRLVGRIPNNTRTQFPDFERALNYLKQTIN